MRRPGWNPLRRNRRIGTAKQGYGQNNEFAIPCRADRVYWTDLSTYSEVKRELGNTAITFLIEPPRLPFYYPLTPEDIIEILSALPSSLREDISLFIFRQGKKRELVLSPVWGRLAYHLKVGQNVGPAIIINSQRTGTFTLSKSLSRDRVQELERLRQDGHKIDMGRKIEITCTPESIRQTVLYRTTLHELGHWNDFIEKVIRPSKVDEHADYWELLDLYESKPLTEKEDYAHRFAFEQGQYLRKNGVIPFQPKLDRLKEDGLNLQWFVPP